MEHQQDLPEGWSWAGAVDARIPLPPGWTSAAPEGGDPIAVLYAPAEGDDGLRPNVVVRRGATHGSSLAAVSSHGMAQILSSWPGSALVSNDAMVLGGHEMRAQRFVLEAAGRSALLERWLVGTGHTAVEVSGTIPVSRFLEMGPLVEQMVMGARFGDAEPLAAAPTPGAFPEPRLDAQVSEAVGLRLEELSGLRRDQGYSLVGPAVTEDALELAQDAARQESRRRRGADEEGSASALLRKQGLIDDRGELTDSGRRLMAPVVDQHACLRVTLSHRGRDSHLHLWLGEGGTSLVAAGAPLHSLLAFTPEDHQRLQSVYVLQEVASESVPRVIAQWIGLGPTWPVQSSMLRMTGRQLQDRLDAGPPAGADPEASLPSRLVDGEWVAVTIEQVPVGSGPSITLVHALGAGYFQPHPVDGGFAGMEAGAVLQFAPLASRQMWDLIVGIVDAALAD